MKAVSTQESDGMIDLEALLAESEPTLPEVPKLVLGPDPKGVLAFAADCIRRAARSRCNVLIYGETGSGKGEVAKAIHEMSALGGCPHVINCATLPESLVESELFGHLRGAFTSATSDREGVFRAANGGTLVLDEVNAMPTRMQARLLRVLEEGKVRPVGADGEKETTARVIAICGGLVKELRLV